MALLAQPGVGEHLDDVDQAAAGAVEPVLAFAGAVELAHDRDLREPDRQAAVAVVDDDLDFGRLARACPRPPPKITSCIDCPRTASGDCSPMAQSTASVTFDFPDPLGPTMTETPGPKSSLVRSGNDLKPLSVIDLRCIQLALTRPPRAPRSRPARPPARRPAWTARCPRRRRTRAPRLRPRTCGRAAGPLRRDHVRDHLAAPGQQLLQGGLEVQRALGRVRDLLQERLHHHRCGGLEPELQVARPDDRFVMDANTRSGARARPRSARRGRARPLPRLSRSRSGTPSRSATRRQARPETACARTFVSRPAPNRSPSCRYRWVETASESTESPRKASRS